jgi:putative ABC transport system permease protein
LALRVTLRMRELAIRRALGASAASLAGAIGLQAILIALSGAALGVIGAILIARGMSSLLYDVTALEPVVYVTAAGLLVLAICAAAAVPTLRTLRTDPREAMRAE